METKKFVIMVWDNGSFLKVQPWDDNIGALSLEYESEEEAKNAIKIVEKFLILPNEKPIPKGNREFTLVEFFRNI